MESSGGKIILKQKAQQFGRYAINMVRMNMNFHLRNVDIIIMCNEIISTWGKLYDFYLTLYGYVNTICETRE